MSDLLKVSDLRIAFHSRDETNEVVHGINFSVETSGQTVAILGESGSGKSVSCMSLTQLLPKPPDCTVSGEILFQGENVLEMDAASKTGVDDVRDLIEFSRYGPTSSKYKIFIIDEVHMLSKQAFNAL
ncbi:MAG: ATP-binding cassette domain-containing protein, partial [Verrucomicrobiota bacterium]|nr:ATP-binding cassette domain-containing protein [Verrucomicrobiota bacterium]